ncbi:DUF1499 domain-containing protein [Psychrobacter pacificensis]|uniref:DUF1499 domain-containing protein n=1 Tax=Psychrobacter pacificensis TaxID=112002 RepID=UPI000B861148|nr:DUF1499 domain-containing protein [Psychrobacter pacificensis]
MGYPELQTLRYDQTQPELVAASTQAIENLGWELVNIDADKDIIEAIEATDITACFGFKDDIVVRITDSENERLVDIRSKSRIGGGDLVKNAARIHGFIDALDGELAN